MWMWMWIRALSALHKVIIQYRKYKSNMKSFGILREKIPGCHPPAARDFSLNSPKCP